MKEKRKKLIYYAVDIQNSSIDQWLKQNKCIPSQPYGILKCPYELIDTCSPFAELFISADGFYPESPFTDRQIALKLQNLGLMFNVLSDEIVLNRAKSIEPLNAKCLICSVERSGLLLCYLGHQMSIHQAISNDLRDISFLPVQSRPSGWLFDWHADMLALKKTKRCKQHNKIRECYQITHFDRPYKVFDSHCKNIVGCVAFIFDNSSFTKRFPSSIEGKNMLRSIGIIGVTIYDVDVNIVINQLLCIAMSFEGVKNEISSKEINGIVHDIYCHIENACKSKNKALEIAEAIKEKEIVFVSGSFVSPDLVARHCRPNCKPFLFRLKDSPLISYKILSECLGITDRFSPSFVALILQQLRNDKGEKSLSNAEIHKVIDVLSCLKDSIVFLHGLYCEVMSIFNDEIEAIYGPDDNGILRDCRTMCFNDYDDIEKSESMIYAHTSFPADLAKFFGVNPKLIHCFEECSDDIEDFYQDEPLVVRLNRLVDGYPCDSGIFKELIQNADDANATEIHFIKDYTMHPHTSIIGPEYETLQGPALLVFNDSAFSNKDLKGIQRLGRGSKSDDPSQTGRYGVGFNAVYNLTDCPSFFTKGGDIENGETLCIFDPLAKYLPNVTRKAPGKRIKNVEWVRQMYGDMMTGYHENKLMKNSSGTIFRFPLRTHDMAQTSEIKKESVDIETISVLLNAFSEEISNVLLFLKNLKKVKISSCFNNKFVEEVCIKVEMEQGELEKQSTFVQHQMQLCKMIQSQKESLFQFDQCEEAYELSIHESRGNKSRETNYIVVQVLGLRKDSEVNRMVKDNILRGKLGLLPHGGVALRYRKGQKKYWEPNENCKAFCFLPLPIQTGLPVHIHGYFALDHETRRTLWRSDDVENCYKSSWNNMLIEHIISTAYVCLLNYTKDIQFREITDKNVPFSMVSNALANFQILFPRKDEVTDPYWKNLLVCIYKQLVSRLVPFLPSVNKIRNVFNVNDTEEVRLTWTPLKVPWSSYPAYIREEESKNRGCNINAILRMIGMRIVYIPKEISDAMEYSNVSISILEPSHVIEFVSIPDYQSNSKYECKIKTNEHVIKTGLQSVENAVRVLRYCLQDYECFNNNLRYIPLLVTQEGKMQTVPENGLFYVEPMTRFCELFPSKRHLFLHGSIASVIDLYLSKKEGRFHGKFKRFDLIDFIHLAKETGQLNENCTSDTAWDKTSPTEAWIRLFWDFFYYQLPDKEKGSVITKQLQIVKCLPLLPIDKTLPEDQFLIQPCNIKFLINLSSFSHIDKLYAAIKHLNLPQVSRTFFEKQVHSSCYELLQRQTANNRNPAEIIECLHFNSCETDIKTLSYDQVKEILWYFEKSQLHSFSQGTLAKLKDLPLFLSHFGQRVMLKHYRTIYVVPRHLPSQGLQDIAEKANVLFLKDTGHKNLFKYLAIEKLSLTKFYAKYIIPLQHLLERNCLYMHLEFLSGTIINEKDEEGAELLSVLRNSPFVERLDGRRVRVCDLYDSEHPVLRRMCDARELVPECLRKFNLLMLFRKIGLMTKLTMQLYIRFARNIEEKGRVEGISKTVSEESKLLSTSLWKQDKIFYQHESFSILSKIKFITPGVVNEKLTAIKNQYNFNQLICFEESVPYSSSNISWTVSNILPEYLDPRLMFQQTEIRTESLNIHLKPKLEKFIRHCEHVGKSLEKVIYLPNIVCHEMLENIMNDMYNALKEFHELNQITDEMIESLRNVPIIYFPKKKIIVTAKCVVMECKQKEEIPPLLLHCPESYQMYTELFLSLGASSKPSCGLFALVLHVLKNISEETELHPLEYSNAVKAMGCFVKYLVKEAPTIALSVDKLYLLSCNETLEDAKSIIVRNNRYFEERLEKCESVKCLYLTGLEKLHENHLKMEDFVENLQYLPDKYRPHLLTDVVTERALLDKITHKGHQHSALYKDFLHSSHFVHGFLRLTRHVWKLKSKQWTAMNEEDISKQISTIDVKQCSGIQTKLALRSIENGKLSKERLIENTNREKFIHKEKTEEGVCIYFDTAEKDWKHTLIKMLTIYLNGLAGDCLENEYFVTLMEMFSKVETPEQISLFLSKENIEEYTLLSTEIDTTPSFPTPGDIVPKKFHQYLDNDYGIIYEHEYKFIALEVDDPGLNIQEDESDGEDPEGENEDFDLTYKFVHIIRMVGPRHELPLFQEYEINYGAEETAIVRAHKLFKFIRKNKIASVRETAVTIYERKTDQHSDESSLPSSLREAYSEVRMILREAWQKDETERTGIVKRLYRKWHPDKNPDNVQFCTKVFQYLRQCLERLEKGLDLIDDDDNQSNNQPSTSQSSSYSSFRNTWYDRYWHRYQRSESYNYSRYNNYGSGSSRSNTSNYFRNFDDTWSHHETHYEPYHWHSRAREWYRQAEFDLQNAMASIEQLDSPQFNWVCYNAHQASEKALKAAWYAKDANKINRIKTSHNIDVIASDLGSSIETYASRLTNLIGEHTKMRYPDDFMCNLPAEIYSDRTARSAIEIAKEILRLVKSSYINN